MNRNTFIKGIFAVRADPNFQEISFSAYLIPLALGLLCFVAYVFGDAYFETELRLTCLAVSGVFVLVLIVHLINANAAQWAAMLGLSGLVFCAAWIWQNPQILYLLALPPLLSTIIINTPAGLLVGLFNTFLFGAVVSQIPEYPLASLTPLVLQMVIWGTLLLVAGGYWLVERVLRHASQDYERMTGLLENARVQQSQVASVLGDLEHANRQLSLLFEKNIALRQVAEEATEAKSTYIAKVSHEIRTPLSMILGITDLIIENEEEYDENLPLDLLEDIHIIQRNSDHLLALVNDVLDLTRAETGHLVLKKDWVDIKAEIEQSLEIVQPLARKKHLQLLLQPSDDLPPIFCDRTRIRQVIVNLLSNAVRYTEDGVVSVWVNADEQWLTVQVKDTGPGVQPSDAERIFEPFFRGITTTKIESGGSGLGLSVSRQLLEVHGGKIWMESQPGVGSNFSFRLPVNDLLPPRQSPAGFISEKWAWVERKRRSTTAANAGKMKRVILCEAEDFLTSKFAGRENLVEFVQLHSFPELIADANQTPAHMILINAPNVDDLLVKMEQAAKVIKETPIVGCTFTPPREKMIEAGALEYIQKPISIKRLRATLQRVSPELKKILIVDDNIEIQHLIARALSLSSDEIEILLAINAGEALEILTWSHPDAILLDLALPDVDGWQLMTQIKKNPAIAQIPIIIISAHDLSDSPPNTHSIVITQNHGFTLEQFIAFTTLNLLGPPGEAG
jgi:signal transduction histidine kinase/CheY-like chemotaxis protein